MKSAMKVSVETFPWIENPHISAISPPIDILKNRLIDAINGILEIENENFFRFSVEGNKKVFIKSLIRYMLVGNATKVTTTIVVINTGQKYTSMKMSAMFPYAIAIVTAKGTPKPNPIISALKNLIIVFKETFFMYSLSSEVSPVASIA